MPPPQDGIEEQVEAAFNYRGHVTIEFKDGTSAEGFVCNRILDNPKLPEDRFLEFIVKNKDEKRRVKISTIKGIELTGEDTAAGKSFEDYQKKKTA